MNNKIMLIAVIVVIILISSFFLFYFQDPVEMCIKRTKSDLKKHKTQYLSGDIIVNFKDNVTKETTSQLIESYNLSINYKYPDQNSALVKVPRGKEIEAMCMLKQDVSIASTELNVIFQMQQ